MHSILGLPALEAEDFSSFNKIVSDMTSIYGAGKICPFENQGCDVETEGLTLEPGIEAILADTENRSWEELTYVWTAWRNGTGRNMRGKIGDYVELSNKAAQANGEDNKEIILS